MKAVLYTDFKSPPTIEKVNDPVCPDHGVVVKVMATGVCLSDWHGWQGTDPDIVLPHVPGHELAGIVEAVGKNVSKWKIGDRVTVPFVGGCGKCFQCTSGNHQVCDNQFQPGFTHWGSFAQFVAIHFADTNLVALPSSMDYTTAASLGCRFATAFRAIAHQGKVSGGQWVAVYGCGGVGLSAIMIAHAFGANVVAVDIADEKLNLARNFGAHVTINATTTDNVPAAIRDSIGHGVHVSLDAIGNEKACFDSIKSLAKRGKHIQVGLLVGSAAQPKLPMSDLLSNELEIIGSHGMQAYKYDEMFDMIKAGTLAPEKLIKKTITLEQSIDVLMNMAQFKTNGVNVITSF